MHIFFFFLLFPDSWSSNPFYRRNHRFAFKGFIRNLRICCVFGAVISSVIYFLLISAEGADISRAPVGADLFYLLEEKNFIF
jgi:hypothetical protein